MAEVNLNQIVNRLNTAFTGDSRMLVFWYDTNAEFINDVDSMELSNAKILHLDKDNQFYIKHFLECVDKITNYLIYAPFPKPDIRENHLADTILYSKEFFADKASLISLDLGIDEKYKPVLQHYIKFFANKERMQRFYDLEINPISRSTIEVALMCVLCKSKTVSFEDVVRCMLTEGNFTNNQYLIEFEKYDLLSVFWKQAESVFGYNDSNPTLEKFVFSLFITYTSKCIRCDIPTSWIPFLSCKSGNVVAFLDNLMNSVLYGESYDFISETVYQSLKVKENFERIGVENILECFLYSGVDEIILQWLRDRLQNEDIGAKLSDKNILEICELRRRKHFGQKYKNEYLLIESAYEIITKGKYENISNIRNLVKEYTSRLYRIDQQYREFYCLYDEIEDVAPFEHIRDLIENIYTNEYLNKITVNWNIEFEEASGETGLRKQKDFYNGFVKPAKDRVVVIISDALRYEVARSLFERFESNEKCHVKMDVMQGVLPSYTPLGMAALLPHRSIKYADDYHVLIDDLPCATTEQRTTILNNYDKESTCIQFDALKNMNKTELRSIFTGMNVVYVYHNQIDARGDSAKTENEVFLACKEAVGEIEKLVKNISSNANTYHFLITADHGFIYKRDKVESSDKIDGLTSTSGTVGQRYFISEDKLEADGVCHTTIGNVLGTNDARIINYPLSSNIFKVPGAGQNYVHGGCSPQEMLVPLIEVKVEKGKKETSNAEISLVSLSNKITNLITSFDFVQTEPVSDVVKAATYRIFFISEANEKISNENICIADKKDKDTTKRIFRFRFNFKNMNYNKTQKYYLVAYDEQTNIEAFRHEVVMDIAFADDFGFF